VLVSGVACLVAGVAMLALPGPGIATIALGLLILATEFAWAAVLLEHVKRRSKKAMDAVASRTRSTLSRQPIQKVPTMTGDPA
jgi:uncharacterized protein (TIGR02611 family)